jgi:hypothetical protein
MKDASTASLRTAADKKKEVSTASLLTKDKKKNAQPTKQAAKSPPEAKEKKPRELPMHNKKEDYPLSPANSMIARSRNMKQSKEKLTVTKKTPVKRLTKNSVAAKLNARDSEETGEGTSE